MRAQIIETESLLQHRRHGLSPRHQEGRLCMRVHECVCVFMHENSVKQVETHYIHTKLSTIAVTLALTMSETVLAQLLDSMLQQLQLRYGAIADGKGGGGVPGPGRRVALKEAPRLSSLLYMKQRQPPTDKGAFRDMSRSQTQQLFI